MTFLNFLFNLHYSSTNSFKLLCLFWLLSLVICVLNLGFFFGIVVNVVFCTVISSIGSTMYDFFKKEPK